ncbi:MAG: nitrilase family protein [Ginsengibacter sp.]
MASKPKTNWQSDGSLADESIQTNMFPLTITLIQSNIFWEDKKANLKMFEQKIEAIEEKTEIVILPEMFNTGFSMKPEILAETMDGETVRWMKRVSSEKKVILTGSVMIEDSAPNQQQKKYFNRLIWMLPNGEMGIYDKRHLFAFAAENEHYSAGNKKLIASVKGWKINLQICYDLRFPVWTRQEPHADENQYDVLINVANWPEKRNIAWQTLLRARAIENQCYAVGVNRVGEDGNRIAYDGNSAIIDPFGTTIYEKKSQEDIFTYTLEKDTISQCRNHFPFLKDADDFIIKQ